MINAQADFFINLAKIQAVMYRRFDSSLWWLSFNEFIILYYLDQAIDNKMRRIDLADKVWLTASWITRILLPMEKIWLITKEINESDARVSLVMIAPGWKSKLDDAIDRAEYLSSQLINKDKIEKFNELSSLLNEIGWNLLWNK